MKTKILIVDDHKLLNDGLKLMLSDTFDIVGQVFNGQDVINSIHLYSPQVVLLDINLPIKNGFIVASELEQNGINVKVIFLSMYSDNLFIEKAKHVNAQGYMLKISTKEEIIKCIDEVMNGNIHYDAKLKQPITNLHQQDSFVKKNAISPRELEVIELIKLGMSSTKMAKILCISQETIKTHRKNIYFKLGVSSLVELINFLNENEYG